MSGIFASLISDREVEDRSWSVYVEAMEKNRRGEGDLVTPDKAMTFSAVYACVRVLSETMASLPLILYERLDRGKRRAREHYLYPLLHDRANELMTAFEFRETVQAHISLWGNAYINMIYDASGRVTELWPLLPGNVMETRREGNRRLYWYQLPNGKMKWLSSDSIWHLRGLGGNGLDGYSVVGFARKAIGVGLSAQEYIKAFYDNDARPGVILEHPGELSDPAHTRIKKDWKETHEGVEKSHRIAILEEGMKLHEVGIPPADAQFLETRKFQIRDIARWFRMQPHKIGDLENATFSNIEHQSIEHVVDTVTPWSVRWEQSIHQNLLLPRDRDRYFAEYLLDSLLRGDIETRYEAYSKGKMGGWLSSNDIREKENMNPVAGGDIYMVPLNMIPAPMAGAGENARQAQIAEIRSMEDRSAMARSRLRNEYLELYREAAQRILSREAIDIKRQMKKDLKRTLLDFLVWMGDYYVEHSKYIKSEMLTINSAYGEAVAGEAMDEVGQDPEMIPEVVRFIDSYSGGYAGRHVGISKDRIAKAITMSQAEEISIEESVGNELDTWEDGRSGTIAEEESTRFNNALAKTIFVVAGIQLIRSVAIGDSCPYCKALNGRVIGVKEWFLSAGEEFEPDGADGPLTSSSNIGHPPYHSGCDCMVIASV